MRPRPSSLLASRLAFAVVLALVATTGTALAGPMVGFTEEFPAANGTANWGGGGGSGIVLSNPGTGGVGGMGDGYLDVSLGTAGNFGTRSQGAEYIGDWTAAGVQHLSIAMQNFGAEPLEIHVCIGNSSNLWESNAGFTPPMGQWQECDVDLTSAANFTRIIGADTFANALAHADRLLIRYDLPPLMQVPDATSGDLGIDHIVMLGVATDVRPTTWGRIKQLYR